MSVLVKSRWVHSGPKAETKPMHCLKSTLVTQNMSTLISSLCEKGGTLCGHAEIMWGCDIAPMMVLNVKKMIVMQDVPKEKTSRMRELLSLLSS